MAVEIVGEALGAAARAVGRLLVWVAMELVGDFLATAVQRTGRFVLRLLRPGSEPGMAACVIVGLLLWGGLIAGAVWLLVDFTPAAD
jgi:hypothetical protein